MLGLETIHYMPKPPEHSNFSKTGQSSGDLAAAVLRSVAGAVPIAGTMIGEIITSIIPDQRMDRLENYLIFLSQEIERLGKAGNEEAIRRPENVALIEDGAYQAARSLTDERRRQIARCVAEGLSNDEKESLSQRRILEIFGQLDDGDILILDAFGSSDRSKFKSIRPPPAHMRSEDAEIEREELYKAAIDHLERLRLLRFSVQMDRSSGIPEYDKFTGQPKGSHAISALGRRVLRQIGIDPDR